MWIYKGTRNAMSFDPCCRINCGRKNRVILYVFKIMCVKMSRPPCLFFQPTLLKLRFWEWRGCTIRGNTELFDLSRAQIFSKLKQNRKKCFKTKLWTCDAVYYTLKNACTISKHYDELWNESHWRFTSKFKIHLNKYMLICSINKF